MDYRTALRHATRESNLDGSVWYVCTLADPMSSPYGEGWAEAYKPDEAASLIDGGLLRCDAILLGGWQVWARSADGRVTGA